MPLTIRQHPRSSIVTKGRHEIETLLLDISQRHEATYAQLYSCLSLSMDQLAIGMRLNVDVSAALADGISAQLRTKLGRILRAWAAEVAQIAARHELTYGELFSTLGLIMADKARYHIRHERHPNDSEKRGDEA